MSERFVKSVGAGVIGAGLWGAMLIGAALASAEPESGSGGGAAPSSAASTSHSAADPKPTDGQPNSGGDTGPSADEPPGPDAADSTSPTATRAPTTGATGSAPPPPTTEPKSTPAAEEDSVVPVTENKVPEAKKEAEESKRAVRVADAPAKPATATSADANRETTDIPEQSAGPAELTEPNPTSEAADEAAPSTLVAQANSAVRRPGTDTAAAATLVAAQAEVAPEPAAPAVPTLLNVLGTIAWSMFDFVSRILEGPPSVPAGSTVSVGRSKLEIDCGDGYTADADWYFPTSGQPDKLIYFQHGFPARAGFYNLTAAELAERNNAIVVAPTITGNLFACDGCSLGADQMHAAVAKLFLGDPVTGERTALMESAAAAGYAGVLPEQLVIAGHSGGGQLAAGAAGYFAEYASDDTRADLRGVLLLDTSATGGALDRALPKLEGIPVLHIAAAPAPLNTYGNANAALEAARPGQFNGFQLVGGTHSDAFRSSTLGGLAQVIVGLVTGPSTPENVEAVQVLAQGWITDWFRTDPATPLVGVYGDPTQPGTIVTIPTDTAADAHAYVLPAPPAQLSIIDLIVKAVLDATPSLVVAPCAADLGDVLSEYAVDVFTENSTQNAALSLDGRGQTGQSVGQHVCTG